MSRLMPPGLHAATRAAGSSAGLVLLALWLTLGLGTPPAWARGTDCAFRTGGTLVLAFGVLDPSAARQVQQRATASRGEDLDVGDCAPGALMRIRVEGGQHDAGGQLRMRHTLRPDAFLPYTVQVSPTAQRGPGNRVYLDLDLAGRLNPADVAQARGGSYSDTLRISVSP